MLQVLLERDVLVSGDNDVELVGGLCKKSSVCETDPAHLSDGLNLVVGQETAESSREGLIQQDSHAR